MINENNKRLINIMLIICVIPFLVPRGIMETGGNLLNSILYYFRLFVIFFHDYMVIHFVLLFEYSDMYN